MKLPIAPLLLLAIVSGICSAATACEETAREPAAHAATWLAVKEGGEKPFWLDSEFDRAAHVLLRHQAELAADAGPSNYLDCGVVEARKDEIDLWVKKATPELLAKVPHEVEGVPVEVRQWPAAMPLPKTGT